MCTVSWHAADGVFTVLFNRDELRQRPAARPPALEVVNGTSALFPIDPEGGGTWLTVNASGVILCMLNFYDREDLGSDRPGNSFTSRGQLLLHLLSARCMDHVSHHVRQKDLNAYRPFHLLLLSPLEQNQWTWSGSELSSYRLQTEDNPLTSSSLRPEDVIPWRCNRYRRTVHSISDARHFHYHQEPGLSDFSVRMEREYARTVSISEICVDSNGIQFIYDDLLSPPSRTALALDPVLSGDSP